MKTKCLETFPWKHLNLKTGNQWKSHRTRTRKVKQSDSSLLSDILQAQTKKTDCSERTSQSQRPFVFTNLNLWSKVPIPATGDGSNLEERMSTNLPTVFKRACFANTVSMQYTRHCSVRCHMKVLFRRLGNCFRHWTWRFACFFNSSRPFRFF